MEAEFNRRLSAYGVTRVGWAVLGAMHFDGQKTPSGLAAFLGIDRAAVTRLLDKLEEQGLIVRDRSGGDRRSVALLVTAKGKSLAAELSVESMAINAQFAAGISAGEIERYVGTVGKMLANSKETAGTL